MPTDFAIVDLFAGPGGLAEGFSSIRAKDGSRPFQIALSVEKEPFAFETLRLRSFFRQFDGVPPTDYYRFLNGEIPEPDWKSLFPEEWERASLETVKLELGSPRATQEIDARLAQITDSYGGNVILIGGPPCAPRLLRVPLTRPASLRFAGRPLPASGARACPGLDPG
jgi:DNA (cytosine-5)-methyltransferase 1